MGLFDRFRGNGGAASGPKVAGSAAEANPTKKDDTFFLDADSAKSLGDVQFMRRSNTIRRTFPGTSDSPGQKEMVAEVASMEARLEKMSPGLAGINPEEQEVTLTDGVPKPVKKTFAQTMTQAELDQRKRGSAVAVNAPGVTPAALRKPKEETAQPSQTAPAAAKPGAIDPFKSMAKDLNL
ncbi:MAG: hypothetical protein ACK55D_09140 [Synechococcaceae cyanobacterium]